MLCYLKMKCYRKDVLLEIDSVDLDSLLCANARSLPVSSLFKMETDDDGKECEIEIFCFIF